MMIGFDINPQTQQLHLKEMEREANMSRQLPKRRFDNMLQAFRRLGAALRRVARPLIARPARAKLQ